MTLQRRKILKQMINLGNGTDSVPADAGGSLTGDKVGIHTFLPTTLSTKDFDDALLNDKISSAFSALSANGGVIRIDVDGGGTISSDVFTAQTKNARVVFTGGTYTSSASLTFPANLTLSFENGGILSMNSGRVATIKAAIDAPPVQIFAGSGTYAISRVPSTGRATPTRTLEVYPEWFGAVGDCVRVLDAAITATDATLTSATAGFTSADVGKIIVVEGAGASSATLITTIASVTSSTEVELTATASTTVSAIQAIFGTSDQTALQTALDSHHRVRLGSNIYGFTALRLHIKNALIGNGMDTSMLSRMGAGAGGPAIAMTTDEAAQSLTLTDFTVLCNQVGSASSLDGIDLGTQSSSYRYGNNSWMNNVRVMSFAGIGFDIGSNIGMVGQLWAQNLPGQGTPSGLSIASSKGIKVVDTQFIAGLLSVEGRFEAGEMDLGAGGSYYGVLQVEPVGDYGSIDSITMNAADIEVGSIFASQWSGLTSVRRDLVRKVTGAARVNIGAIKQHPTVPVTVTNLVNDVDSAIVHSSWAQPFTSYTSINFGAIAAQQQADIAVAISGPRAGDTVKVTAPAAIYAQPVTVDAWVSASDEVTVRLANHSTGTTADFAAATFRIDVWPR